MDSLIMLYLIPIIIAGILLFLIKKRESGTTKRRGSDIAITGVLPSLEVMLVDIEARENYVTTLPGEKLAQIVEQCGQLGNKKHYDTYGKEYYTIFKNGDSYTTTMPEPNRKHPPEKLFICFEGLKYLVEAAMPKKSHDGIFQRYGPIIWVGILTLGVMFLLVAGK